MKIWGNNRDKILSIRYAKGVWFLILLNHVLMLIGLYYMPSYHWLSLTFIGLFLQALGGEIGTHRYLAHRSFKTGKIRDFLLQITTILTCVGSPMVWAMFHRHHHKTSDKDGRLGYCWMHHFKCHSARSCRTWAKGCPITKDSVSYDWQERNKDNV